MSALSIYQSLSGGTKPQIQAKSPPVKKIKRKENGIQQNKKSNQKKRMRPLKSSMRLSSSEKEKSKAEKDCETHNGEGFESPALDALLTDLAKVNNSRDRANRQFQWLIHPVQDKSFFRDNWEKKPILIQRQNPDYYKGLFSTAEFDRILRNDDVQYGVNLDVTSYTNGKERHTILQEERYHTLCGIFMRVAVLSECSILKRFPPLCGKCSLFFRRSLAVWRVQTYT